MIDSRILLTCLIVVAAVYCLPADKTSAKPSTDKTSKETAKTCKPNFCQTVKVKCAGSCNGTFVQSKNPCECCPICVDYIEEGDRCVFDGELPPGEKPVVENEMNDKIIKSEENVNKGKDCRPGLICLLGTCVTLF